MTSSLEQGFRLGNWQVRPHAGRLASGWLKKSVRRVEPKAMQVLLALAARPGQFRSKDDLLASVWQGRPVSDDCLTGAIHALRHALNDDPRDPRFIETRNNIGYRLIAEVRKDKPRSRWSMALAAVIPLIALVAVFVFSERWSHPAVHELRTIAVLPFMNLSGSSDDNYLAAAMMDALISDLARRRRIRVISRTSVMQYRGYTGSADEIARKLGADMLVEGSVQTSNGYVRVSARLINPFSDGHLWTGQYDRSLDNIFELQREISTEIATQIGGVVGDPESPTATHLPPGELHQYLQSRYLLAKANVSAVEVAFQGFAELSEARPQFAPAHLGQAQSLLFLFKAGAKDINALDQALNAANDFEALSGASAASHRCIGQIRLLLDWDFATAEQRYRQAILQNPSDTVARRRYAWLLVAQNHYEQAKAQINHIRMLDPLYYENAEMATLLLYAGEVGEAISEFERLDAATSLGKSVLRVMATAYLAEGREADARRTLVRMLRASGTAPADGLQHVEAMDSPELYRYILRVKPFRSQIVSAGFRNLLGEADAALSDLERAVASRDPYVIYLGALPELADLRSHPRFQAILADVGIVPGNHMDTAIPKLPSASIKEAQDGNRESPAARH